MITDDALDPDTSDFHRYCSQQLLKKIYERHALTIAKFAQDRRIPIFIIPFDDFQEDMVANYLCKFEKDQLRKHAK